MVGLATRDLAPDAAWPDPCCVATRQASKGGSKGMRGSPNDADAGDDDDDDDAVAVVVVVTCHVGLFGPTRDECNHGFGQARLAETMAVEVAAARGDKLLVTSYK